MDVSGAGAIVFGGASGLGEATVRRLVAEGAIVLIADLSAERGRALASEIGASATACDVTSPESVVAAVEKAATLTRRGLRISVSCAGLATPAKLIGHDGPTLLERFEKVVEVNLLGTINTLRVVATEMKKRTPDCPGGARGVCINTASIAAFDGQVGQIAYAASKAGVVGLTLPAARELSTSGIRVVSIAPGVFDTPLLAGLPEQARRSLEATTLFPSRLGDPAEFAALVAHVIANDMLNGETIRLDGALRMAPR